MAGARKASSKPAKSLEATLWAAADKLRGNLEASEYKHVVLGLVFLKYVSDAFTARRLELQAALADPASDDHIPSQARRKRILESRDEYTSHNVFWVPPRARWEHLLDNAKQPGIGQYLDEAMDLIEHENPRLKGVLPKYFGDELLAVDDQVVAASTVREHELLGLHEQPDPQHGSYTRPA